MLEGSDEWLYSPSITQLPESSCCGFSHKDFFIPKGSDEWLYSPDISQPPLGSRLFPPQFPLFTALF
jgi:hypothetical protein